MIWIIQFVFWIDYNLLKINIGCIEKEQNFFLIYNLEIKWDSKEIGRMSKMKIHPWMFFLSIFISVVEEI